MRMVYLKYTMLIFQILKIEYLYTEGASASSSSISIKGSVVICSVGKCSVGALQFSDVAPGPRQRRNYREHRVY